MQNTSTPRSFRQTEHKILHETFGMYECALVVKHHWPRSRPIQQRANVVGLCFSISTVHSRHREQLLTVVRHIAYGGLKIPMTGKARRKLSRGHTYRCRARWCTIRHHLHTWNTPVPSYTASVLRSFLCITTHDNRGLQQYIGWSDVTYLWSQCDRHFVGQHVVLCVVKWWRFVA